MPRLLAAIVAAALALAAAGEARASGWFDPNGVWAPVGLELGGSFNGQDRGGFFIGPEASVVYFSDGVWAGGFADAVWDFGSDQFRHAIGPELGFGPLGVDFAYLGVLEDGDYRPGYAARGMITFSVLAVYGRYGHVFDNAPIPTFGEVGVLLKLPLPVKLEPRVRPPPPAPPPRPDGVAAPLPDGEVAVPVPTAPTEPPRDFADPPSGPKPVAPPPDLLQPRR
jgi:hypothetical protein